MEDKKELTFSNIIYLTSACQLECKYCYEAETRKKLDKDFYISEEEIREAIDFFDTRNYGERNICLFGGEPLLAWDKIQYLIKYIDSKKYDDFSFNLITNGIRLSDEKFFNEFFDFFDKYEDMHLKLEISYDGTGQSERVFPDGSSSEELVLNTLNLLESKGNPFYTRYTLNCKTYDLVEKELIYQFEKYKNLAGITINVAASDLDKIEGDYKKSVSKKSPYFEGIYHLFHKPICDFACKFCGICKPKDFNMHYIPKLGNKITEKRQEGFDRWNPLVGEEYIEKRYDMEGNVVDV